MTNLAFFLSTPQTIDAVFRLDGHRLSTRTLADWARQGVAVPSRWPQRRGRYNPRGYTVRDVAIVRLVLRLRRAGVSMQQVKRIIDRPDVRASLRRDTRAELVVTSGSRVRFYRQGAPSYELPNGQALLPLAPCAEGIDEAVKSVRGYLALG